MKKAFMAVLLIISLAHSALAADENAKIRLTLKEAVDIALKENPGIKASQSSQLASRQDISAAQAHLGPKVTLEERFMRTNNPTYAFSSKLNQGRFEPSDFSIDSLNAPSSINDYQTSVSIMLPIYSKEANVGVAISRVEAETKGYELHARQDEIALRTVIAYLGVTTAQAYFDAARVALEEAREHRRISEERYKNGIGLYTDTLRVEVFHKEAEERLQKAGGQLELARRALGLTIGLQEPVGVINGPTAQAPRKLDSYMDIAILRPDVRIMEMRLQNAVNALKLAQAKYLPYVGVSGAYQMNHDSMPLGNQGDSYQVSAFLQWQLFDSGIRSAESSAAKYRVEAASQYLEGMKQAIQFNVRQTYIGMEQATYGLSIAQARKALALESKRILATRFENGLSTVVELLDAQASLDGARASEIERENGYLSALYTLLYESGEITKELSK